MDNASRGLRLALDAALHARRGAVDTGVGRIAPGRTTAHRAAADALRAAGLWAPLCRAALWQEASTGGRTVHSESSALAGIFNHTGVQESGGSELGRRMLDAVGPETLARALQDAGRRHILQAAWHYWARVLQLPPSDVDAAPEEFADGWVARLGPPVAHGHGALPQGCVPETFPDENIGWGVYRDTDVVYPLPF